MSTRPVSRVAVVSLALLATACGSTPVAEAPGGESSSASRTAEAEETTPEPARSSRASVCTMLPKTEMETLLGGPLASADGKDTPGKTQCTYAGFGGRFADVAIDWGNGEAGMAGARLASRLMGSTAGDIQVMKAVEGLGDEAMMMIGGVLNVRTGADLITVDLRTQQNPEVVAAAIARKIIERM